MTYHDEATAERDWHSRSSAPGRSPVNRTHPAYIRGGDAYHMGQDESHCPHMGGDAARHWVAGWRDAAQTAEHDRDRWNRNLEDTNHGW